MPKLISIFTKPYGGECVNYGCQFRQTPSRKEMLHRAMLSCTRIAFLVVIGASVTNHVAMMVHAQSTTQRLSSVEASGMNDGFRLTALETWRMGVEERLMHDESEIAVQHGIDVGIWAALGALQILQIVMGKKSS